VDSNTINPCAQQQLLSIALQNAGLNGNDYLDSLRTAVSSEYTNHCLSAVENFTDEYRDKEFHFTLYYYDQAGNLTKTIPPEGITIAFRLQSTRDPVEVQVNHDRTFGTAYGIYGTCDADDL